MAEPQVLEPAAAPAPQSEGAPAPAPAADPFALDENALISLTPEQRAGLEPILEGWKKKALEQVENTKKSVEAEYKPHREKADALDQLTQWKPFQDFWRQQQTALAQGQPPETAEAVAQSKPQDFATPEEWSQAVLEAANGAPAKLQDIQKRMWAAMATPVVQEVNARQRQVETQLEMKNLMEEHPDYKELDQIWLGEPNKSQTALEFFLDWAERNNKPLEEGYKLCRSFADGIGSVKQAQAMGLVNSKKDAVTSGPSTASGGPTIVYVDTQDELIRSAMRAELEGKKDIRFEIRPKK